VQFRATAAAATFALGREPARGWLLLSKARADQCFGLTVGFADVAVFRGCWSGYAHVGGMQLGPEAARGGGVGSRGPSSRRSFDEHAPSASRLAANKVVSRDVEVSRMIHPLDSMPYYN